jgi:hypothetical protein
LNHLQAFHALVASIVAFNDNIFVWFEMLCIPNNILFVFSNQFLKDSIVLETSWTLSFQFLVSHKLAFVVFHIPSKEDIILIRV